MQEKVYYVYIMANEARGSAFQFVRGIKGNEFPLVENTNTVAPLGLLHNVRR